MIETYVQFKDILSEKKDEDRREVKGRRCCLGGRIDKIPYHASYFVPGRYEELDELREDDMKNRMKYHLLHHAG